MLFGFSDLEDGGVVRRWDRNAWALIIGLPLLVFGLSLWFHPRLISSGEYDQYLQIAEAMLRGDVAHDAFHPLLYPMLVALAGCATPTVFIGGKLVTACAFGLLLWSVHRLLRRCASARLAWFGTLAIGLGPVLWREGMLVATDMAGTALVLAAWTVALTPGASRRIPFLAGLLVGCAATVRFNLGLHVPLLILTALLSDERWRRALWTGLGVVVGVAPHVAVRLVSHGSAFDNENWKNIVLKYDFARDMPLMRQQTDADLQARLHERWPDWLAQGFGDFGAWLVDGLPRLQLDRAGELGSWDLLVLAVLGVGVGLALVRRLAGSLPLVCAALAHALLINLTFVPEPRLMMTSTILILIVALWGYVGGPATLTALLVVGVGVIHGLAIPDSWRQFRAAHATPEVAAAHALVADHGSLLQLAGTYPFLDREVECVGRAMILGFANRREVSEDEFWQRLEATRAKHNSSWFLLGRVTGPSLYDFARRIEMRPGWRRVHSDDDLVVLAREGDVDLALTVTPGADGAGGHRLRLEASMADAEPFVWVGVELVGPDRGRQRLKLEPLGQAYGRDLPPGALTAGAWSVVPVAMLAGGRIDRGEPVAIMVR